MNIKRVPISEVRVWDKNPRNIKTKDFERLKRQIQELGLYKPLICVRENGRYITLGGNMRLRALQELKQKEVDISIVKAKDEATKIKYALSDNDRAGEYDELQLAELAYPHVEEINLEDYKIDVGKPISLKDVIEDYGPDLDGEDEILEIDDSPAITKKGDLFTLGKHKLLCGDATKEEDVKRLMNGKKADMVFTDPPDDIQFNPKPFLSLAEKVIFFGANNFANQLSNSSHWLVWDKQHLAISQDKMTFGDCELLWTNIKNRINVKIYRFHWRGFVREGGRKEELKKRIHPTQKPVGLYSRIIKDYSDENNKIWDGFLGSGTTLIACEKLNRICMGMEIEPKYVDICITRYSNFTGIPEKEIRATRQNG